MNPNVAMTLDDAVAEVIGALTGSDLQYRPELDRYQTVVRALNRAVRSVARSAEWSYYSSIEIVSTAAEGQQSVILRGTSRLRLIGDDSIRLVDPTDDRVIHWAYVQPRDALHKYRNQPGLWCSVTRQTIDFSRPFMKSEDGWNIVAPVMREPKLFVLPKQPEDPSLPLVEVPIETREQLVDFSDPDFVVAKATYYLAQSDPLLQPRVQTLEQEWKDIMYDLTERDQRVTDSPFINDYDLGISADIGGHAPHFGHPHQDFGQFYG